MEYVDVTHCKEIDAGQRVEEHFECVCVHFAELALTLPQIASIIDTIKAMRFGISKKGFEVLQQATECSKLLGSMIQKLEILKGEGMECLIKQDKIGLADIMIKSRDIKREFDKLKEVKDVKNFLFTRWINEMKKESLDDNSIHQNNSIEQKDIEIKNTTQILKDYNFEYPQSQSALIPKNNDEEKKVLNKNSVPDNMNMMNAFKAYFALQSQKLNPNSTSESPSTFALPKNYNLKIFMNSLIDIQRLKKLKTIFINQLASCTLGNIEHSEAELIEFLDNLKSQKAIESLSQLNSNDCIECFYFNYPSLEKYWTKKLPISPYVNHLPLSRITKELYFMCITISSSELETIINNSIKLQRLVIDFCKVAVDEEIKIENTSIIDLSLQECCGDEINISEASIENLVSAICKSGMKEKLKRFNVYECAIDVDCVKEMFRKKCSCTDCSSLRTVGNNNDNCVISIKIK